MVKELLRTIPHALSGRSKFGRTLMYMSPVASSTIDAASECLNILLVLLAHQPDTSYQAQQIRYDSRQQRM